MSDAIAAALAAAENEANSLPPAPPPAAATPAPAAGAVPMPAAAAPRSLLDVMANAAMNVEAFLAVSENGIKVGKDRQLHDTIDVEMKFGDAKAGYTLRVTSGGTTRFLTSYDGVTEARSRQSWSAVLADAVKLAPDAYPSDLIELPCKLINDAKKKEGDKPWPAGTVVGLSLSYMNVKAFLAWLKDHYNDYGPNTPVKVRLKAIPRRNAGGAEYGVFGYEIIK